MDLLLGYVSRRTGGSGRDSSTRVVGWSGHIRRLAFVISMTDAEGRM
jgi:hypothetical protein